MKVKNNTEMVIKLRNKGVTLDIFPHAEVDVAEELQDARMFVIAMSSGALTECKDEEIPVEPETEAPAEASTEPETEAVTEAEPQTGKKKTAKK